MSAGIGGGTPRNAGRAGLSASVRRSSSFQHGSSRRSDAWGSRRQCCCNNLDRRGGTGPPRMGGCARGILLDSSSIFLVLPLGRGSPHESAFLVLVGESSAKADGGLRRLSLDFQGGLMMKRRKRRGRRGRRRTCSTRSFKKKEGREKKEKKE